MASQNSFGTRTRLDRRRVSTFDIFSLPALERAGFPGIARLPYSLKILLENLLRREDGRFVKAADIEALARLGRQERRRRRRSRSRRRACCCRTSPACPRRRPRGDARRHRRGSAAIRTRSTRCSRSSSSSTTRCRSTLLRPAQRRSAERRARVLAQQGALRVPALGPGRVSQLPRRAARHRHRPPGEPRIPRARGLQRTISRRRRARVSRTRWSAPTRTRRW